MVWIQFSHESMMNGWVRRTPPCICRRGRRTYITLRGVRAPPHVSVDSYAAVAFVRICLYGLKFPFDDDKDRGSIFLASLAQVFFIFFNSGKLIEIRGGYYAIYIELLQDLIRASP